MAQMTGTVGYRTLLLSLSIFSAICVGLIQSPLPPPGLEAPHRLSTRLQISQMLHPPTALLLFSSPLSSPLYPPYVKRQTNNSLQSTFSVYFLQICPSLSVRPPAAHHGVVRLPSSVTVKGPGNLGVMGRGDRSFVGVKTHDPQRGREISGRGITVLKSRPFTSHWMMCYWRSFCHFYVLVIYMVMDHHHIQLLKHCSSTTLRYLHSRILIFCYFYFC